MLRYNFYNHTNYPLQRYYYTDIPCSILEVIKKLNKEFELIVRGGLSYILITNDFSYELKDIDLAMKDIESEKIYHSIMNDADEIFFNKNTFGDNMLTLFWKKEEGYYKLDILLVDKMPNYITVEFEIADTKIKVMSAVDLWFNRICKISEKTLRKHSNEKTLNHYKIVMCLAQFLLKADRIGAFFINDFEIKKVQEKYSDSIVVLSELLTSSELAEYKNANYNLIKKYWEIENEGVNMPVEKSW